ncbi:hypothetical protein SLS62_001922 [Diatrype stigma]|uniref:MICOS complex subunit MIC12 n=1 Tax=Diatrype stigma TaxID=117547 RepID=A0AAN9V0Y8_9PEZI
MGFTTGFTGGVTLTLSVAYLGALAHRRHREHQAAILRQQTLTLTALHDPRAPQLPPLTRAERLAEERHKLIDTAKGRWNAEVEHAARWAQTKDWEEVRDGLEDAVAGLWARAFGNSSGGSHDVAEGAADGAKAAASKAWSEVRGAGNAAAAKADEVAASDSGSSAAGGGVWGALGKGFSRGKEAITGLGGAKTEVEAAEEKAAEKFREKLSGLSPEEKAMKQRYQKTPGADDRSVEEILAERYLPTDRKNNTQLKAL